MTSTEEHLSDEIQALRKRIRELEKEIETLNLRLSERDEVIEALRSAPKGVVRIPFEGVVR